MLKYAYIIRAKGQSPEKYSAVYDNAESSNLVAGFDNIEAAKEYVKGLLDEGYTLINLCSAFDDAFVDELMEKAPEDVKIKHVSYFEEEATKLAARENKTDYGVVIVMRGVEEPYKIDLDGGENLSSHIIFVKDLKQAEAAAAELKDRGADFIELCSWFHTDETKAVIEAVGGQVPVGTCGDI